MRAEYAAKVHEFISIENGFARNCLFEWVGKFDISECEKVGRSEKGHALIFIGWMVRITVSNESYES